MVTEQMYDEEVGGAGSIKELAAAISCLQVAPVAKDVEELLAQRDRLDAKISGILRVFEAELGWAEDGSLSLTAWLAAHGRRSRKEAHREAVCVAMRTDIIERVAERARVPHHRAERAEHRAALPHGEPHSEVGAS